MTNRYINDNCVNLIKSFEGLSLHPYNGAADRPDVFTIGYGTCLGIGTSIRMANGSIKSVENIYPGEYIMGVDNLPKKVLFRTEGYSNLINIKGYDYEYNVTPDHLLVFDKSIPAYNVKVNLKKFKKEQGFHCLTAKSFVGKDTRLLMYEARHSFDISSKPVKIDPYILGSWLGDGCIGLGVFFCQLNNEVLDYWKSVYPNHNCPEVGIKYSSTKKIKATQPFYRFYAGNAASNFRYYKLLHEKIGNHKPTRYKSRAIKYIPKDYLYNNEEIRLQVLAGIIDTDGCVIKRKDKKNTGNIKLELSLKYDTLIKDIIELIQSLGFCAKTYIYNRKGYPNPFKIISITGNLTKIPLKIKYKRDNLVDKIKPNRIQKVENLKISGHWIGHTVEDNLILLSNGIITHNTQYPPNYLGGKPVALTDAPITQEQALEFLKYEIAKKSLAIDPLLREDLTPNQFGALLSFAYNLGEGSLKTSTLRIKVNAKPDDPSIKNEFVKWVYSNGQKQFGLLRRRAAESALYFTP